jgi:hypothetical protein
VQRREADETEGACQDNASNVHVGDGFLEQLVYPVGKESMANFAMWSRMVRKTPIRLFLNA